MSRRVPTAKVFRVDLDVPLRPLEVEETYERALLVVRRNGRVLGFVDVPGLTTLPVDVQRAAVVSQLGRTIWQADLEERFLTAVGRSQRTFTQPRVSVVVCTRDRPDDLRRCLESLGELDPAPHQVIVVDSAPTTAARAVADRFDVVYLLEPNVGQSRARNRGIVAADGELVAFTDDDCVVDGAWLADLGAEFADPRVAAVTGIVAPLELSTPSQWLFEAHGGHRRGVRRRVIDGAHVNAIMSVGRLGVGANVVFRRSVFERLGLFREWLGPGTPARAADDYDVFCRILAAGDRVVYDPARLVWHRHRTDMTALRRTLRDYGCSSSALATQRILVDGDLSALRVFQWWWLTHLGEDVGRLFRGADERIPFHLTLGELAGTVAGPIALARSRRSRRSIPPVELPPRTRPASRIVSEPVAGRSLSVVVVSVGRASSLERLMRALAAQTHDAAGTEVIVILDGGSDDSAARLRSLELPFRLVVEEVRPVGVAAARNAGVARATGELVIFLDDDVVPERGCLAAHAAAHADGDSDIVLGYAPPVVDGDWWSLVIRAWWEDHFLRKADASRTLRWNDIVTLNSSFPAHVLADLGGFDEAFTRRHEDWELGIRALEQGKRVRYEPRAIARHHLDGSLVGALRHQREEARADVLLTRRHPAVGGELPLAATLAGGPEPPRPAGDAETAARLERQGRRGAWRRLTRALLREAYLAGIRDALPTPEAVRDLAASVDAVPPIVLDVHLDGGPVPVVPPIGRVELALHVGGQLVARVAPAPPGQPWDWRTALEQVEHEASDELRTAFVRLGLSQSAAVEPEAARAT